MLAKAVKELAELCVDRNDWCLKGWRIAYAKQVTRVMLCSSQIRSEPTPQKQRIEVFRVRFFNALVPTSTSAGWHLTLFIIAASATLVGGLMLLKVKAGRPADQTVLALWTDKEGRAQSAPQQILFSIDGSGKVLTYNSHLTSWLGISNGQWLTTDELDRFL